MAVHSHTPWIRTICAGLLASSISSATQAQFVDSEHKKNWFYLQELATEIVEVRNCMLAPSNLLSGSITGSRPYLTAMLAREDKFVREVDEYIKKYSEARPKSEPFNNFRFRVWNTALMVGEQKARAVAQLDCQLFTKG